MNNRAAGIQGENIATEYLKRHGYKILQRNFACKTGEIDIICEHKNMLVFVEVKSRENTLFGTPAQAVTPSKVRSIVRTAQAYLVKSGKVNSACRFDVIEVLRGEVNHIEDAFRP